MKIILACVSATTLIITGCATSSKEIASTYVSPIQYQTLDCGQISSELQRIHSRTSQLSGRLDEAAANDKAIGWAGALLFWPALFALGGTKEQEAEYARLKGEYDALQQAAVQKRCATTITAPPSQAMPAPATSKN